MSYNSSDFSERLTQIIDNEYGGNIRKFSEDTKIPYTSAIDYAKGLKKDPKISFILKIRNSLKAININWLITGKGMPFLGSFSLKGKSYSLGKREDYRNVSTDSLRVQDLNKLLDSKEAQIQTLHELIKTKDQLIEQLSKKN
ncbi:hypothetical protein [Reichenbachiella ulvae]|uniref:Bacteriophage CI repressor helix-turn-helix domain-containing protein n=1 Tax=Reichenbachiella ulvae TaxID=2980104 RepID=A0ABT3CV49_9BACT|nr:hypothetical protein [Reichenbachiella ulvae]MCV9387494.1 hypothetical protein [Reichenbachiella ulvae]